MKNGFLSVKKNFLQDKKKCFHVWENIFQVQVSDYFNSEWPLLGIQMFSCIFKKKYYMKYVPATTKEYRLLAFITIIGALTAFFAGTVGIFQNDLKRVIAYSTCSQLGYMVFICGLSGYEIAFFHLVNHAFFKALLFLSAGSVIHAVADEQDMRRMGGILKLMPFTYTMFL